MGAPLRKIVDVELRKVAVSITRNGRHLLLKSGYEKVYSLECGHIATGPSSAPCLVHKRCKKCEASS